MVAISSLGLLLLSWFPPSGGKGSSRLHTHTVVQILPPGKRTALGGQSCCTHYTDRRTFFSPVFILSVVCTNAWPSTPPLTNATRAGQPLICVYAHRDDSGMTEMFAVHVCVYTCRNTGTVLYILEQERLNFEPTS